MNPRHSYDQIAEIYDEDMGRNMPFDDVAFYVACALEKPEHILELGCGTGRITLPLLQAGLQVTAADISGGMLAVLRRKVTSSADNSRLNLVQMDIRQSALGGIFSTVLCPYSLITYVVERAEQREFLRCVRQLLSPDGQFVVDVFVPSAAVQYGEVIRDYRRALPDGREVERSKVIEQDSTVEANIIQRTYCIRDRFGNLLQTFTTTDRIRAFYPDQLRAILEEAGFTIAAAVWDYGATSIPTSVRFLTYRCRLS